MAAMALLTAVEYDGGRRGILIFAADVERKSSLSDPSRAAHFSIDTLGVGAPEIVDYGLAEVIAVV